MTTREQETLSKIREELEIVRAGLIAAQRMIDEALPKFDWARSPLDGNAIMLLNEAPGKVAQALVALKRIGG